MQIIPKASDLDSYELNTRVQSIAYLDLNISSLPLFIVHNVLNQATEDLKTRENLVYE